MTIECYDTNCVYHSFNDDVEREVEPFCYEESCHFEEVDDV